uniref:Uncharacterized protein n=1 Tax=Anguilla anguilla TaxID=7936 RepID=A0A0E9T022_ANGAN
MFTLHLKVTWASQTPALLCYYWLRLAEKESSPINSTVCTAALYFVPCVHTRSQVCVPADYLSQLRLGKRG